MIHPLEQRFREFVEAGSLIRNGDTLVAAVSGGADSMALLHLLLSLRNEFRLNLLVGHVNHQLRGEESEGDEEFVRSVARSLSLPFQAQRVNTMEYAGREGLSKQEAARELRYHFFEELRSKQGARAIATGHQADDNAETVLLNALRGAGIRGLSGIPIRREDGTIIRPLLFARRTEIEEYLQARSISFRHDSSNDSLVYKRNVLRKTVIPLLQAEIHPDVVGSLNRVSSVMRQLDDRIRHEVDQRWGSIVSMTPTGATQVRISTLLAEPVFLREEIILRLLRSLHIELHADKILQVLGLCTHITGHSLQLSGEMTVYRDRDVLVFLRKNDGEKPDLMVEPGQTYTFPSFRFTVRPMDIPPRTVTAGPGVALVDAARLGKQLRLRTWKKGDWFMPLGMQSRKKLSDFFTDEKIPRFEKDHIPILESDHGIVWVCGLRLDDRFKVTASTRSVVRLEFIPTISY